MTRAAPWWWRSIGPSASTRPDPTRGFGLLETGKAKHDPQRGGVSDGNHADLDF
jgi:hypothetical protein